ncbi:fibronectin type III domain-containing protein [Micromonospora sp. NPDC050686]|uniref:fibronectin type III domain-containing protein n=1 Tax=Micromonospora sp. NPDC050686 TaxID=3154631 RepID=UPI0033F0BBEC
MKLLSRAGRRTVSLVTASVLGCAAAVGPAAAPAAAAVPAPAGLTTAGQPCATAEPGPYLSPVLLNDAQAVVLRGTFDRTGAGAAPRADFQVWDVADPAHPQQWLRDVGEQSDQVYVQLEDPSKQLDGVTYAWRVRVLDGADASPWSGTCHFTVDRSGGPAPTVASAEYPAGSWDDAHGAVGVPGTFTFTPASDDTVSYRYQLYSGELWNETVEATVAAERLGGPASVRWTPRAASYHSLTVYAVDRAGNHSPAARHEFHVRETRPSVYSSDYRDWGDANLDYNVGVPGAFELRSGLADTASFAWRIDQDGPSGTVPAKADGTATAMIAPTRAGRQTLYVHSVTRDGTAHADRAYPFLVDDGPRVTDDTGDTGGPVVLIGSSHTFRLTPRAPNVRAYLYWPKYFDDTGAEPVEKATLPARTDGTADLTWTATATRLDGLYVQSRSADGHLSEPRYTRLSVDGAWPTVTRSGGVDFGTPATFTARTRMVKPVEYEAVLDWDPATKRVIKAAADGSATFTYTAPKAGQHYVSVVARNAAGVTTDGNAVGWTVTDRPRVTSTEFPEDGVGRLAPGVFTFSPRLPGTTRYEYSVNDSAYTSIAAQSDGTAKLTWTPPAAGTHQLLVRSVTAGGVRSMSTGYGFKVEALPPPPVTNLKATGGVGSAALSWTLPSILDLSQVIVRRATGTTAPSSPTSGTAVYAGTGRSVTATGLASGTTYTFRVWVKDRGGRYSTVAPSVRLTGTRATIGSNVTALAYGSAVTVTGKLVRADTGAAIGGASVQLYGRRKGSTAWTLIATATSNSYGNLAYSHKPSWSLDYKWVYRNSVTYQGSESALRTVGVKTTISASLSRTSVALGGSVTLSGKVSPSHAGKYVYLQRYVNGRWTTVANRTLSSTSGYSFAIKPSARGTYTYRVHKPADTDHLAGYSVTRSFKVS